MADGVAVVAVMSVQPTSEKRTVLQLAGSPARAIPLTVRGTSANAIRLTQHDMPKFPSDP